MYFEQKIYKILNEEDDDQQGGRINMSDPVMQQTGWYKDNPDLTIGGVLKQGEEHPAYKDAMDIVAKEKGSAPGGEDEKEVKPAPKIDVNPFDKDDTDKPELDFIPKVKEPKTIPEPEPENPDHEFDTENDYEASNSKSEQENSAKNLGDISQAIESGEKMNRTAALKADQSIQDIMLKYGARKNKAGGFSTTDYDDATDKTSYKAIDDDRMNDILSKETGRTPNEIANLRDKVSDVKLEYIKQPFREHYNRLFKGRDII